MRNVSLKNSTLNLLDEGSGPPLLLVHGFPLDHSVWRHQIAHFSQTHRVLAPDLRGFGQSGPLSDMATMRDFADDLADLLAAIGETRPVIFCGLSMGGYIAWQFVLNYRSKLAALIVCDSLATADAPEPARGRLVAAERLEKEGNNAFLVESMLPRLFGEKLLSESPEFVTTTKQIMLSTSAKTCAAAQRGMAERSDMANLLPLIDLPTLILCGETDIIAPTAKMREIAAAIPGAVYAEIAGAGHMAPLEKPVEVNAAIEKFLGAVKNN